MNRSDCPSAEELAAFLDGRLSAAARRAMVEHLDECPDCYEVFSESARFLQEDAPRGQVLPAGRRFTVRRVSWAVASVAAVLTLLVLLPLVWSLRSAPPPAGIRLATSELVRGMGQVGRAARAVPPGISGTAAFGGGVSREQLSFRVGARLLDLRVAAEAEDRQAAEDALDGLAGLAETAGWTGEPMKTLEAASRAARASSFGPVGRAADELEAAAERRLARQELALGKWAEAGDLAATAGDRALFTRSDFVGFPETIDQGSLPERARAALERFERLTVSGGPPQGDLTSLERVFEALEQMY